MNTIKMNHQLCAVLVTCHLLLFVCGESRAETVDELFNVRVVLPGATEVLDVAQTALFPLCPQFFISLVGSGSFGVSLKNDAATSEEVIFMLGIAFSDAGTVPIFRLGTSKGMISQIIEIGSVRSPFGFVWLYCGVAQADKDPVYLYELRLSFMP